MVTRCLRTIAKKTSKDYIIKAAYSKPRGAKGSDNDTQGIQMQPLTTD